MKSRIRKNEEHECLERLRSELQSRGVNPRIDLDESGHLVLRSPASCVYLVGKHYRVEHVANDGNSTRTILVSIFRMSDAARLVVEYSRNGNATDHEDAISTARPDSLKEALTWALWSPRDLARAVNEWLERNGRPERCINASTPYSWVKYGYIPYDPLPIAVAAVLSQRLNIELSASDLWPTPKRRSPLMSPRKN